MIAHGALDHAELAALGIAPDTLIDFSSNLNPFGPPASVRAALATLDPAPYPDRSCRQLRLTLAARHACDPAQILPGNGANELIHLLARALLRPGQISLVIGPTFGEYAHASRLAGGEVREWRADQSDNFALNLPTIAEQIARLRPRLTWLCAPNNPTGIDLSADAIHDLAKRCAAVDGLLVIDRAYASFLRDSVPPFHQAEQGLESEGQADTPNLLRLHSLTKSYAIAGLRLGYLLGEETLIERVAALQPTWSVSSAALAAGAAALADQYFLATSLPRLWAGSDTLHAGLRGLGLRVHRAATPFMLVEVSGKSRGVTSIAVGAPIPAAEQTMSASATRAALLRHGYAVRDCSSFGLPNWVRVSPQLPHQNTSLLAAWGEIL